MNDILIAYYLLLIFVPLLKFVDVIGNAMLIRLFFLLRGHKKMTAASYTPILLLEIVEWDYFEKKWEKYGNPC